MARSQLVLFSTQRAVNGFFDGISALETCLTETHRAVRFASALSRAGVIMPDGSTVVPRTARSGVLSARTASRIGRLRNALQHLDDRILEGDLGLSQAFGPRPEATSLSVGRMSVEYGELVGWLIELDSIAARVQYITRCDAVPTQKSVKRQTR
jgi:hypothetical protein